MNAYDLVIDMQGLIKVSNYFKTYCLHSKLIGFDRHSAIREKLASNFFYSKNF